MSASSDLFNELSRNPETFRERLLASNSVHAARLIEHAVIALNSTSVRMFQLLTSPIASRTDPNPTKLLAAIQQTLAIHSKLIRQPSFIRGAAFDTISSHLRLVDWIREASTRVKAVDLLWLLCWRDQEVENAERVIQGLSAVASDNQIRSHSRQDTLTSTVSRAKALEHLLMQSGVINHEVRELLKNVLGRFRDVQSRLLSACAIRDHAVTSNNISMHSKDFLTKCRALQDELERQGDRETDFSVILLELTQLALEWCMRATLSTGGEPSGAGEVVSARSLLCSKIDDFAHVLSKTLAKLQVFPHPAVRQACVYAAQSCLQATSTLVKSTRITAAFGCTSTGKSSWIQLLAGVNLLPVSDRACTALPVFLLHDPARASAPPHLSLTLAGWLNGVARMLATAYEALGECFEPHRVRPSPMDDALTLLCSQHEVLNRVVSGAIRFETSYEGEEPIKRVLSDSNALVRLLHCLQADDTSVQPLSLAIRPAVAQEWLSTLTWQALPVVRCSFRSIPAHDHGTALGQLGLLDTPGLMERNSVGERLTMDALGVCSTVLFITDGQTGDSNSTAQLAQRLASQLQRHADDGVDRLGGTAYTLPVVLMRNKSDQSDWWRTLFPRTNLPEFTGEGAAQACAEREAEVQRLLRTFDCLMVQKENIILGSALAAQQCADIQRAHDMRSSDDKEAPANLFRIIQEHPCIKEALLPLLGMDYDEAETDEERLELIASGKFTTRLAKTASHAGDRTGIKTIVSKIGCAGLCLEEARHVLLNTTRRILGDSSLIATRDSYKMCKPKGGR